MYGIELGLVVVAVAGCACILTSFVAILSLRHVVRSLDVFLSSVLLALLGNVGIVVLMPSLMVVLGRLEDWDTLTCKMYVWAVISLRISSVASFVAIAVERLLLIRRPGKYNYRATLTVCVGIMMIWLVSMCVAAIPVAGWAQFEYRVNTNHLPYNNTATPGVNLGFHIHCTMFVHELHHALGVFFIVLEFSSMLGSVICITDIYCHLRYLTKQTLFSSKSPGALSVGRNCYADLGIPNGPSPVRSAASTNNSLTKDINSKNVFLSQTANGSTRNIFGQVNSAYKSSTSINKSNDVMSVFMNHNDVLKIETESEKREKSDPDLPLDTVQGSVKFASAYESCRSVVMILAAMFLLNHIPYTVLTTYGVIQPLDSTLGHIIVFWLLSLEALVVPAILCAFNTRYRKAYVRVFRCCCNHNFFLKDEDPLLVDGTSSRSALDYASHHNRYHDISKMVHKTLHRQPLNYHINLGMSNSTLSQVSSDTQNDVSQAVHTTETTSGSSHPTAPAELNRDTLCEVHIESRSSRSDQCEASSTEPTKQSQSNNSPETAITTLSVPVGRSNQVNNCQMTDHSYIVTTECSINRDSPNYNGGESIPNGTKILNQNSDPTSQIITKEEPEREGASDEATDGHSSEDGSTDNSSSEGSSFNDVEYTLDDIEDALSDGGADDTPSHPNELSGGAKAPIASSNVTGIFQPSSAFTNQLDNMSVSSESDNAKQDGVDEMLTGISENNLDVAIHRDPHGSKIRFENIDDTLGEVSFVEEPTTFPFEEDEFDQLFNYQCGNEVWESFARTSGQPNELSLMEELLTAQNQETYEDRMSRTNSHSKLDHPGLSPVRPSSPDPPGFASDLPPQKTDAGVVSEYFENAFTPNVLYNIQEHDEEDLNDHDLISRHITRDRSHVDLEIERRGRGRVIGTFPDNKLN